MNGSESVARLKRVVVETEESRQKALERFKPRPTDLFVASTPKSGTTWMQQIVHGLRSGGSMDFNNIEEVFPYIEMAHDCGYTDLDKDQEYFPRTFKTHTWYPHCPKGAAKYVFVVRNPEQAAASNYDYWNGWMFSRDSVSLEEYLETKYLARGRPKSILENASYWDILSSWYPHRTDPNVLWMHYEDMLNDLPKCVELVSKFIGIGVGDTELLELVEKQASFEFMKAHWKQFDERPQKAMNNERWGRPPQAGTSGQNSKVRLGKRGKIEFSDAIQRKFDMKWETIVKPATGYASYKELREGVNKELGRKFNEH